MKKKDLFQRTRLNIILVSIGIVVGSLLIFAVITEVLYRSRLFKNTDQQLQMEKNMIIRNPSIIKMKGDQEEIIIPAPITTDLLSYVWKDGVLVDESPHSYKGENEYPNFEGHKIGEIFTLEDGGYNYRAVQFEKQGALVQLLISVDDELQSVEELRQVLCIAFLSLLIIAFILASYLASIVLKPLRSSYNKQVAFIQDASHEMRTPLAIMKGRLELLARYSEELIGDHFEEISIIMGEIRGLEKMNSDLLLMSKEDVDNFTELKHFQVNSLLKEVGEFYSDLAEVQEKQFHLELLPQDVEVCWDYIKVKRCIVILLENALKYTKQGDHITLKVTKQDKGLKIYVEDTGMGIREEDKPYIFERFFRSKEVRAESIEGSGIGLSLLRSIANNLGIKIYMESQYGQGTLFCLEIQYKTPHFSRSNE